MTAGNDTPDAGRAGREATDADRQVALLKRFPGLAILLWSYIDGDGALHFARQHQAELRTLFAVAAPDTAARAEAERFRKVLEEIVAYGETVDRAYRGAKDAYRDGQMRGTMEQADKARAALAREG